MRQPWHASYSLVTSGEADQVRADAQAAVTALWGANPHKRFFGFVRHRDGGPVPSAAGRGVLIEDTSEAIAFDLRSQMWDWHHQIVHDPQPYGFVALFEQDPGGILRMVVAHGDRRQASLPGHL